MWKCASIFLCYCIGIYFLWLNPDNANHKFIFYVCSSIPVGIFCHMMGKVGYAHKQLGFVDILLSGVVVLLGTLTAYVILIDFYKDHKMFFICLLLSLMVSMVVLVVWIRKVRK